MLDSLLDVHQRSAYGDVSDLPHDCRIQLIALIGTGNFVLVETVVAISRQEPANVQSEVEVIHSLARG